MLRPLALLLFFAVILVTLAAPAVEAADRSPTGESAAITPSAAATPVAEAESGQPGALPRTRDSYGPILSRDPLVRAQIKRLYLDQAELVRIADENLAALGERLRTETDPDFRYEINREIGAVKRGLEADHTRLGLEIARLNGDTARVAELELALDQMLHPENYVPESSVDPSLEIERLRQFQQD